MDLLENEINTQIGLRIKYYRIKNNLTQKELADKCKLKHSTVSAYEHGKVTVGIYNLYLLAKIFDVEIYDLLPNGKTSESKFNVETEQIINNLSHQLSELNHSSLQKIMEIIQLSLDLHNENKKDNY